MEPRLIDTVRNEITEANRSLQDAVRVAVRAITAHSSMPGDDLRALRQLDSDMRIVMDRCIWLYQRFREAELELEHLYNEIDDAMFIEDGEQLDPFAD